MTDPATQGSQAPSADTLLRFPCEFPIKVMGERREGFAQEVLRAIDDLAPNVPADRVEMRVSKGARYISLTIPVWALSKEQLDAIYLRLTGHPWVKVVL